ncbi:MAG: hypothetical protein WBC04_08975 [Candidatus Acidiferrales bacterium]
MVYFYVRVFDESKGCLRYVASLATPVAGRPAQVEHFADFPADALPLSWNDAVRLYREFVDTSQRAEVQDAANEPVQNYNDPGPAPQTETEEAPSPKTELPILRPGEDAPETFRGLHPEKLSDGYWHLVVPSAKYGHVDLRAKSRRELYVMILNDPLYHEFAKTLPPDEAAPESPRSGEAHSEKS